MVSQIEATPQLSREYRRLTFNYDLIEKERSRICFSPPLNGDKSRDLSMPRGFSRNLFSENNISHGSILRSIETDILSKAKHLVNEAIMNKKIFTILGPYDKLRQALKSRGWVEKMAEEKAIATLYGKLNKMSDKSKMNANDEDQNNQKNGKDSDNVQKNEYEDKLDSVASLLVLNCTADLIWSLRLTQIDERSLKANQMINHFKRAGSFTTKIGLIKSFNYLCWYEKNDDEVFPRSYILTDANEKKAFLDDYYLTACMGLLKIIAQILDSGPGENNEENEEYSIPRPDKNNSTCEPHKVKPMINYNSKEVGDSKYKVDHRFTEMAIHYCEFHLKYHNNKDLDQRHVVFCSPKRWEEFFENYYNVTNNGFGIECNEYIRDRCVCICNELKRIHPQFNLDGTKNIWIVKPGAKSRGRGIFCASKFSEINDVVRTTSETLIVQKYIETPLLVYKTKFDIRQWFLVTSWSPLTIWWYKDSYVRFCSQQFTLNDFNEAVHLSNNSIQYKYQNGSRSKYLPQDNMWEWQNLDNYLNNNGYKDGWKKKILPSMKDIIIDVLLCSQEEIEDRKNSFELYGADFMVTAGDLKTWLLEINSSPCMAPSTDVTARLTKSVLEDVMKVMLDYPENISCDTGQFELLYKQSPFSKPIIECSDKLAISGIGIRKPLVSVQAIKRDVINAKKSTIIDDGLMFRHKLKQVVDYPKPSKDPGKVSESSISVNTDQRTSDRNINQMSLDLKNKRLQEYMDHAQSRDHRRTRSHNLEVSNRLRSSIPRLGSQRLISSPRLTSSTVVNDAYKNSKYYGRSLQPIKKDTGDEVHRGHHTQPTLHTRFNDRNFKLRASNDENSLMVKLQNWKQMDKSQNLRLHQILKAYLPYLD